MLELDLALHSRDLDPDTSSTPTVIPVLWDASDSKVGDDHVYDEVREFWQWQLDSWNKNEWNCTWVDPVRWAGNVQRLKELQAIRRSDAKGDWRKLAERIAERCNEAMPNQVDVDDIVVGADRQMKELLKHLRVERDTVRGVWLRGIGGALLH
jgi:hypothetical protein